MGDALGIVIDSAILELLRIQPDTPLEISTDGKRLIIQPVWNPAPVVAAESGRAPMGPEPADFEAPRTSAALVDELVLEFHMTNDQFRSLHHARNYANTFKAHRDYCANHDGRFRAGGTNEMTARRLFACLASLRAGRSWDDAISEAVIRSPK
jgi:hypothetical protein